MREGERELSARLCVCDLLHGKRVLSTGRPWSELVVQILLLQRVGEGGGALQPLNNIPELCFLCSIIFMFYKKQQ